MSRTVTSPRVTHLSWGHLEIQGGESFKDVKLFPGGAREWDWRETGTRHSPGIQPEDVEELVRNGATTVILARGMWGRLRVPLDTLESLRRKGVRVHVAKTKEAVQLYNETRSTEPVGALVHTTC